MREICHICHESNNPCVAKNMHISSKQWDLEDVEIPELGKLRVCDDCLEKIQDFIKKMLRKKGGGQ